MELISLSLIFLFISGILSVSFNKKAIFASSTGMIGCLIASLIGIIPAFKVLINGASLETSIPYLFLNSEIHLCLDPLSAIFLVVLFIIVFIISFFGHEYLLEHYKHKSIGVFWLFFNLLVISMILVLVAKNGLLFLIAWELSAISSFFLVTFEQEKKTVRDAGLIYLIAANIGAAFLIPLFVMLSNDGSLNFEQFGLNGKSPLIFLLAFFGFGIKAGFVPFHIWLPKAHSASPSQVSALMSGVMIELGIYGIIRTITFIDPIPVWIALLLISIGICSGILGIIFSFGQNDIKRILAYSSIENVGVIALALGIGVLGICLNIIPLIILGLTGSIFHIMNHAIFKSLLFLGSGSIYLATGTRNINLLGGLQKLMPKTGIFFLIGIMAITALPILNGFLSEFVIYMAAFKGVVIGNFFCLAAVIGLAIIGGLAVVSFSGIYGIVFLGEPRSKFASDAKEVPFLMNFSLFFLALACFLISWFSPYVLSFLTPVISQIGRTSQDAVAASMILEIKKPLFFITIGSIIFMGAVSIFYYIRKVLFRKKRSDKTITWDCGFVKPTSRMQYNFASFVQPVVDNFKIILNSKYNIFYINKIFPKKGIVAKSIYGIIYQIFYRPFIEKFYAFSFKLKKIQHGNLNLYILYILLTLFFLLIFSRG